MSPSARHLSKKTAARLTSQNASPPVAYAAAARRVQYAGGRYRCHVKIIKTMLNYTSNQKSIYTAFIIALLSSPEREIPPGR